MGKSWKISIHKNSIVFSGYLSIIDLNAWRDHYWTLKRSLLHIKIRILAFLNRKGACWKTKEVVYGTYGIGLWQQTVDKAFVGFAILCRKYT